MRRSEIDSECCLFLRDISIPLDVKPLRVCNRFSATDPGAVRCTLPLQHLVGASRRQHRERLPLVWLSSWHVGLGAIEVYLRPHLSRWACRKAAVRCLGLDSLESPRNQRHSPQGCVGQEARLATDLRETQTALLGAAGGSANNVVAGEGPSPSHSLHL